MIPDFKTFIKESIWSDMQDRGSGDAVKKEDLVPYEDLKDYDVVDILYKYLIQNYRPLGDEAIKLDYVTYGVKEYPYITIPITLDGKSIFTENDQEEPSQIWSIMFNKNLLEYIEEMHIEDFEMDEDGDNYQGREYVRAYPDSSPVMCNEVVDFLDELLDLVPNPALKKI